jgi:hypothetical protein
VGGGAGAAAAAASNGGGAAAHVPDAIEAAVMALARSDLQHSGTDEAGGSASGGSGLLASFGESRAAAERWLC